MPSLARAMLAAALAAAMAVSAAAAADKDDGQERLGLRAGYLETFDGLHATYGEGWDIALSFTDRLYSKVLLDIRLGAIYFGDALDPTLDDIVTLNPDVVSSLRFFYFSAGPLLGFKMGTSFSGNVSAGIGIYSVSVRFSPGISAYDYSDQHIGFNGGLGVARRITGSMFAELSSTVHYFGVDKNNSDLYWVFTGGADAPLLVGLALGVVVELH